MSKTKEKITFVADFVDEDIAENIQDATRTEMLLCQIIRELSSIRSELDAMQGWRKA